jgi:hypothetical protein
MKQLFYLYCFVLLLAGLPVAAQSIKITAAASQHNILIGEPFQLTFRVQMPEGTSLDWFKTDTFPHFEIQSRSPIDTVRNGAGQQILVQNIRLTSWDSGRWSLPPFALSRSNRTRPIPITVSFSPMDPTQPYHEIKDVQEVTRPGYQAWWWYLVGFALLLLLLLLLFPPKKKEKKGHVPTPEDAYRDAIRQLDALDKQKEAMPVKDFYTGLIAVMRIYLLHRKGYGSTSKTTADIQGQLRGWGFNSGEERKLLDTLQLSDGVKFARFEPSAAEKKASVDSIREAVVLMEKRTKPG